MDRRKVWKAAERLLKQGKVQAALAELQKVSVGSAGDVVALNRLADLLSQQGKKREAIGYYEKIARQFEDGGFVPKAIAIHKKIVRLDPDCVESVVRLGQLYGRQKLHGEARKYLLHAANCFLKQSDIGRAREVFEQLVAAEPDEVRHRIRLAETRAAEGEVDQAVAELVDVGTTLLAESANAEAEKVFDRARELGPKAEGALIGVARCREAGGRSDEALEVLETRLAASTPTPAVQGELARLYEKAGRSDDAFRLLESASLFEIPDDTWRRFFEPSIDAGSTEALWWRIEGLFGAHGNDPRFARWLSMLGDIEPNGHIPALARLADIHEQSGEPLKAVQSLDALARAYRTRAMNDEAARVLERIKRATPPDEEPGATATPEPLIEQTSLVPPAAGPQPAVVVDAAADELPLDAEAPAVPLNRTDEEFVSGRLTQAEVLEKYDLLPQALEQLDEAAQRFPGHLQTQERRVEILGSVDDPSRLADALTRLAVARRAAGELDAARDAAGEALKMTELGSASRALLGQLGLTEVAPPAGAAPPAAAPPAAAPPAAAPSVAAPSVAAEPATPSARADRPGPSVPQSAEIVIDLDEDDEDAVAPAADPPRTMRTPSPDMLEEIRGELHRGNASEARRRVDALCVLGYAGPELGQLRREIEQVSPGPPSSVETSVPTIAEPPLADVPVVELMIDPDPAEGSRPNDEGAAELLQSQRPMIDLEIGDDDLSAIKAALEQDVLIDDDCDPIVPESADDEDIGEILGAFKKRVAEEVDDDDYRTHYDLGIGFKEMGLLDEAISEFRHAVASPELKQEACAMIALCHREKAEWSEAVEWYRSALDAGENGSEVARGLRYDLAELLLECGDEQAALLQFRDVLDVDPAFRDVRVRIDELESRLQT